MVPGLVSLVGVGPGDPGLLTLRAVRALSLADCVVHDALVHPRVLRHARPDAERLLVGKRRGVESPSQDEINQLLAWRSRQGRRVARLKGGDPYLFARGAEEALFLAHNHIPFEVVPGVTAALGAAAYAGFPLSHRTLASRVTFVTASAHDHEDASLEGIGPHGTLVLYMGRHRLEEHLARLQAQGWEGSTPAAAVQWATVPHQRTVTATLDTLARRCEEEKLGTPAVVIVGATVELRAALRWWDLHPLQGKCVLVTRAREQSDTLVEALFDRGAEALELPVIAFEAPTDSGALDGALRRLQARAYGLLAFTSANGVGWFFRALKARGLDARALGGALVACVGPGTAGALGAQGITPDLVATEARGEGLATALRGWDRLELRGCRVLVLRAEVAGDELPQGLCAAGAAVDAVAVYRTVPDASASPEEVRRRLREGLLDAVTFTSGSTVEGLCDLLGEDLAALQQVTVAVLGPVTARAARARGLTVAVQSPEPTIASLLDALTAHFTTPPP